MPNRRIHFADLLILCLVVSGCSSTKPQPQIRSILSDATPSSLVSCAVPRDVTIEVAPIVDSRPAHETKDVSQGRYRYFIPYLTPFPGIGILPLGFRSRKEGPVFAKPEYYDPDLLGNLQKLVSDVLEKSNISRQEDSRALLLNIELLHYYGVSYTKSLKVLFVAAYIGQDYKFFPTGFVSLRLSLTDRQTGDLISSRYVSNGFLFNPNESGTSAAYSAEGVAGHTSTDNATSVATVSLRKVVSELPVVVDQMLSEAAVTPTATEAEPNTFTLLRLTREYDFVERILVDYETGHIVSDELVERAIPVFSRPDEWVVAPIGSDGHWLSREQYLGLVNHLNAKYDIGFADNLDAAVFKGLPVAPPSSEIFTETFEDNRNGWWEGEDDQHRFSLANSRYVMEYRSETGGWFSPKSVGLTEGDDFAINSVMYHQDGRNDQAFGLVWGMKDTENYSAMLISGNGYFQVRREVSGVTSMVIDWTKTAAIDENNGANRIRVERRGGQLRLFVNNQLLGEVPAEQLLGNMVGFVVYGTQTIAIENIRVMKLSG